MAEASKLKPLEVELKRLEDLSESIVQDFAYMREREQEMRDTNGKNKNLINNIIFIDIILFRIDQLKSSLFLIVFFVLFGWIGYLASALSSKILQNQKIN